MWDSIRKFFKKDTPPVNEEVVQTNIEESSTEIKSGPKDGMSETHFRSQEKPPTALNKNPAEAIEKDPAGISRMGEAPTTTQEQVIQNNEERIKSIIEEGNRSKEAQSFINQETPTQKWTEKHPSKRAGASVKPPEEPKVAETPEVNEVAEPTETGNSNISRPPEITEGEVPSEGKAVGPPAGFGGKGLDVLDEKENFIEENDEPLSQIDEGTQNPVENLVGNDITQESNSVDRLTALFHNFQESEKDAMSTVQDKTEDLQLGQDGNNEPGNTDRLAALFRDGNQEPETNNLPEISDGQKDALYQTFNESGAESEVEDYFPVDKSATLDFANDEVINDIDIGDLDVGDDMDMDFDI